MKYIINNIIVLYYIVFRNKYDYKVFEGVIIYRKKGSYPWFYLSQKPI